MIKTNSRGAEDSAFGGWFFKIPYFYLLFSLAIETANGFFIYANIGLGQSLVVGLKLMIFVVLFAFWVSRSSASLLMAALSAVAFLLALAVHSVYFPTGVGMPSPNYSAKGLGVEGTAQISVKVMLNLLAAYYVVYMFQNGEYSRLKKIAYINNGVIFFNFILALLGVGFANYSAGDGAEFGGTGFFYAGNELGNAMIFGVAALLVIGRGTAMPYIVIIFCVIGALAILSKTALLFAAIISFSYIYFISKKILTVITLVSIPVLGVFSREIIQYFEFTINRWSYFIDRGGLASFLLGGEKRIFYSMEIISNFIAHPVYALVGGGWTGYAENNFFDLIDAFGVLGAVVFFIWTALIFKGTGQFFYRHEVGRARTASYRTAVVASVMVFFTSILAGHAIQSTLILPFLGFIAMKKGALIRG